MILPQENSFLRANTTQRKTMQGEEIPMEVLQSLSDLILNEIELLRQANKFKSDLERMRGYSVITLFKLIDVHGHNYLSPQNIHSFMCEQSEANDKR